MVVEGAARFNAAVVPCLFRDLGQLLSLACTSLFISEIQVTSRPPSATMLAMFGAIACLV